MGLYKSAFLELIHQKAFTLFFLLNLIVGPFGLYIVQNFNNRFESVILEKGKELLGADLSVRSRKPMDKEKLHLIENNFKKQFIKDEVKDIFSMAKGKSLPRLVQIRVITKKYPFYGELTLKNKKSFSTDFYQGRSVVIYPELKTILGVNDGEEIIIGDRSFLVDDVVEKDSTLALNFSNMAGRIYISERGLEKASLIQTGSTLRYYTNYKFLEEIKPPVLEEIKKISKNIIDDNSVDVDTPKDASENSSRAIGILNDFLSMVALVGPCLSFVALFFLYRGFLEKKKKETAIYLFLGPSKKDVFFMRLVQLFTLSVISSMIAIFLGYILSGYISNQLGQFLGIKFITGFDIKVSLIILSINLIGSILLLFPLILKNLLVTPKELFSQSQIENKSFKFTELIYYLPFMLFLLILSIFLGHSYFNGPVFIGALFLLGVCIWPMLNWVLGFLNRHLKFKKFEFSFILKYLTRFRFSTSVLFLAIIFSIILLVVIPQLEINLNQDLSFDGANQPPQFFLFDIQEEQVLNIKKFSKDHDIELKALSPMIRARISKVNGEKYGDHKEKSFFRTREAQRESNFRNRGVNLTFRDNVFNSEKIINGISFSEYKDKDIPPVSLEKRYASRMGFKIGDIIEFDILGIPQLARVINLRSVKWTSFLPNFFIVFPEGIIDDAPKTYLGAMSLMNKNELSKTQNLFFTQFPNVSFIDVEGLIGKIMVLFNYISTAMKSMSIFCLISGIFVIYSIILFQVNNRKNDIVFLKIMGLESKKILKMHLFEFFILLSSAGLIGIFFGVLISYLISLYVFEGQFVFSFLPMIILYFSILIPGLFVAFLATRKVVKVSLLSFLK